jgi:hypothetical protein
MRARIAELTAEAATLREFAEAAERGEHDDEQRIASSVALMLPIPEAKKGLFGGVKGKSRQEQEQERIEQARQVQRNTLALQALNRVTEEIYPEIHELQFKLSGQ